MKCKNCGRFYLNWSFKEGYCPVCRKLNLQEFKEKIQKHNDLKSIS